MHRERESKYCDVTGMNCFLGSYPKILSFPGGKCEYSMYTVHLHMFMSYLHWHIVLCAQYLWIFFNIHQPHSTSLLVNVYSLQ